MEREGERASERERGRGREEWREGERERERDRICRRELETLLRRFHRRLPGLALL